MPESAATHSSELLLRRHFLTTSLAATAALTFGELSLPAARATERQSEVEKFLLNFPEAGRIPGIEAVEIIRHDQATKVLCVIEQIHWLDDIKPPELRLVEACQLQLYRAYQYLKNNSATQMTTLYVEGVYHGAEDEILDFKREDFDRRMQQITGPYDHAAIMSMSLEVHRPDLQSLSTLQRKIDRSTTLAKIGAAEVLKFHNQLEIRGAEDKATYLKTFELEDQCRWDELNDWIYDRRENALVGFVAETREQTGYTVYGCNHNFRDNIAAYNAENDQKFSLVILTPFAVSKFRERKKQRDEDTLRGRTIVPPPPANGRGRIAEPFIPGF